MFSKPSENLMLSTTVSMLGKVLAMRAVSIPFSNGANRFGSNVSVCAIPPPIHRMMRVSAVGAIFSCCSAKTGRAYPAATAESVAALAVRRKSRRVQSVLLFIFYEDAKSVFEIRFHCITFRIPKGFHNSAQGCRVREATLGWSLHNIHNPETVA